MERLPVKGSHTAQDHDCFASRGHIDAFIAVHGAYVRPSASGIDDSNEILCSPISHVDQAGRKVG